MVGMRVWMTLGLFALSSFAAGPDRKAGLWEVSSTTTWIQSPFPNGMAPPTGPQSMKVCLTQEMIDKFGGPPPQTRAGCQVQNVVMKPGGMSAEMVCTAPMSGKGTYEATWTDSDHSTGTVHFTGEIKMGPNSKPVEWKSQSTSTFVSADCGSVRPLGAPVPHQP
jgi:Protein of unknown function (DUF3617)